VKGRQKNTNTVEKSELLLKKKRMVDYVFMSDPTVFMRMNQNPGFKNGEREAKNTTRKIRNAAKK
jgi:hypothetical protein